MIRVMLVQPHSLYARALSLLVGQQEDMQLVGIGRDVLSSLELMDREGLADVAIIDRFVSGDSPDGIEVASLLRKHFPTLEVILTAQYFYSSSRIRAQKAGIKGMVLKHKAAESLPAAIRSVYSEDTVTGEDMDVTTSNPLPYGLTANEMRVLAGLAKGHKPMDIALDMQRREASIRGYQRNLMAKLNTDSAHELEAVAQHLGLV